MLNYNYAKEKNPHTNAYIINYIYIINYVYIINIIVYLYSILSRRYREKHVMLYNHN